MSDSLPDYKTSLLGSGHCLVGRAAVRVLWVPALLISPVGRTARHRMSPAATPHCTNRLSSTLRDGAQYLVSLPPGGSIPHPSHGNSRPSLSGVLGRSAVCRAPHTIILPGRPRSPHSTAARGRGLHHFSPAPQTVAITRPCQTSTRMRKTVSLSKTSFPVLDRRGIH